MEKYKVYVAGKFAERRKVKSFMNQIKHFDCEITCDWTKHVAPEAILNKTEWTYKGHTYAQEDLKGVKDCKLLVALLDDYRLFYKGSWIEVGIAIGLNKMILLVGEDIETVFMGLPNVRTVKTLDEAKIIIFGLASEHYRSENIHYIG